MRTVISATTAIALFSTAAFGMPHGRPGLWNITTSMKMANMPQIPPEALAMMKQRGMKIPGMGGAPIVSQICMTPQDVTEGAQAAQRMREQHDVKCTPRVISESMSSVTTEITCHGMMEGIGHSQMSWRGDSHYEGDYSFKGVMHGQPTETSSHFMGDFVKSDCGAVKPFRAKDVP
jgi:Protein of unknown function (DUF3617)